MINIQISNPQKKSKEKKENDFFTPFHIDSVCDVRFELEAYVTENKNSIDIWWFYQKSLFNPSFIEIFVNDYMRLVKFFILNPERTYEHFKSHGKKQKFLPPKN